MKTKPILFNTPMVQAVLDERKTQTRRSRGLETVNEYLKGDPHNHSYPASKYYNGKLEQRIEVWDKSFVVKPQYHINNILWVRETWSPGGFENGIKTPFIYKADGDPNYKKIGETTFRTKWKPSIFMPKEACRIFLKVTNVRVERLQDISDEDAVREGCGKILHGTYTELPWFKNYSNRHHILTAVHSFASLWQKINGLGSWQQNPWVWVYDFERTEKPKKFL